MHRAPHRRPTWLALALALLWSSAPLAASSHGDLVTGEPAPNAEVAHVPHTVTAYFSADLVATGSSLTVIDANQQVVDRGDATLRAAGGPGGVVAALAVDLKPRLPAGTYSAFWRITALDGHTNAGAYSFVALGPSASGRTDWPRRYAPWLGIAVLGLTTGVILIAQTRRGRHHSARSAPRRAARR